MANEIDFAKAPHERFEAEYEIFHDFVWGNDVVLEFAVLEVAGEEETLGVLYDSMEHGMTPYPAKADVFLGGSIKWDGCSNWSFPSSHACMLHFCGQQGAMMLGRLMQRLYEITATRMPKFDYSLAEMKKPEADA